MGLKVGVDLCVQWFWVVCCFMCVSVGVDLYVYKSFGLPFELWV